MVVLSIKPRLAIWAPFGSVTQKRTVPVVEIEPLNVVPVGNMTGSRPPDDERVKVEVVAAEAKRADKEIIISAVNAVHEYILVFSIFPLGDA